MPEGVQSITTDALEIASSAPKSDSIPSSLNTVILSSLIEIIIELFILNLFLIVMVLVD